MTEYIIVLRFTDKNGRAGEQWFGIWCERLDGATLKEKMEELQGEYRWTSVGLHFIWKVE